MTASTVSASEASASVIDFLANGRTLISAGIKSIDAGRKSAASTAAAIIAADNPAAAMALFFKGARGPYLEARASGARETATKIGKAWKLVRDAVAYHFSNSGLTATWPNWASNDGECSLVAKSEASAAKREAAAARAEAEAADLATYTAERASAELAALMELGPTDLAASLAATITTWSGDTAQHASVIADLIARLGLSHVYQPIASKPAASKPAASKPAASVG